MRATVRDRDELKAVSQADIRAYLTAKLWRPEQSGNVEWWTFDSSARHAEILLPTDASVRDYVLRISQALHILEDVENRSQLEVLRDINSVGLDVVRLRAPESDSKLNSIALRQGARLVDHAMEMMGAAASSAVEPRKVRGH
jgi:hypothetical protein